VSGIYQLREFGVFDTYTLWEVDENKCFPASTPIAISATETRPIRDIRIGDTVLAFDPAAGLGRGALVPRRVVRTHRNATREWVRPGRAESGAARAPEIRHREARKAA